MSFVYGLRWCSELPYVVSCSRDGKCIVWDCEEGNLILSIPLRTSSIMSCDISDNTRFVMTGGLDNICTIFNLANENSVGVCRELSGHSGYVSCVRFLNNHQVLSASGDNTIILWDFEIDSIVKHFSKAHDADVMCVDFWEDRQTFVSGACDNMAKMWDLRTGKSEGA